VQGRDCLRVDAPPVSLFRVEQTRIELRPRAEAHERCPYCHDWLETPVGRTTLPGDLVVCGGCHTAHHRVCIEELGRCTVRGCERVLELGGPPAPAAEEPAEAPRSSAFRAARAHIRDKVRVFVRDNVHRNDGGAEDGVRLRLELADAIVRAREAERTGDLQARADALHDVARIERLARPGQLQGVRGRIPADEAVELAARCERRAAQRQVNGALAGVLVAVVVVVLIIVFAAVR
jgi:hypothetical protein